jgi:hypothetical protein
MGGINNRRGIIGAETGQGGNLILDTHLYISKYKSINNDTFSVSFIANIIVKTELIVLYLNI